MDLQRYSADALQLSPGLFFWHTLMPVRWWRSVANFSEIQLQIRGHSHVRVLSRRINGETEVLAEAELTLATPWKITISSQGVKWLWLEVAEEQAIESVHWSISEKIELPQVTVVMPTFQREGDACIQAARFLEDELVGHVVVVDQARTLHKNPEFTQLRRTYPDRLVFIQQANLGGSGGYARGMAESLRWPDDAVLNSDDDAQLPAESLRRMVLAQAFAAKRGQEVIIGTAMISAENPTEVISGAEWVNPGPFMWGAADGLIEPVDIAEQKEHALSSFELQHKPNYSGWWGTLLPPGAVQKIGLPAPYFIKWDDAEYGLRAERLGYKVLTLPGVGVWHPTWGAKSTTGSWMSMPMHRNRLATAAAYGASRKVILDSFIHQIKHILSLQYLPAELWAESIDQMSQGPEAWLGSDLQKVRPRAQAIVDKGALDEPKKRDAQLSKIRSIPLDVIASVMGLCRIAATEPKTVRTVPAHMLSWRDGLGADVVVLTGPDGQSIGELRRRSVRARHLLARTIRQHLRLAAEWNSLNRRYSHALTRVTSQDFWHQQFDAEPEEY